MTLTLYRVQKTKRWNGQPEAGFSKQGRWHSGGRAVLYLAESPALAVLEWIKSKMSVGLIESEIGHAELLLIGLTLDLDPASLPCVYPADLPPGWERVPNIHSQVTQQLGNDWLSSRKSLGLRVPSAALPTGMGWNVLINTGHANYPTPMASADIVATAFDLSYFLGA